MVPIQTAVWRLKQFKKAYAPSVTASTKVRQARPKLLLMRAGRCDEQRCGVDAESGLEIQAEQFEPGTLGTVGK